MAHNPDAHRARRGTLGPMLTIIIGAVGLGVALIALLVPAVRFLLAAGRP